MARRAIEIEPYDESAHRAVMRYLASSGRQAEAMVQYETLKRTLELEIRAEPSAESASLAEQIASGSFRAGQPQLGMLRGYELQELLGEGYFGVVYRAHQAVVGRDVAIKAILPEYADDPDFIRRFESEAQLVARLEHPYIVPLYDYWREPGGAYLVMRWLKGGSLKAALEHGPWSGEAAARLVDQVTSALAAAHRQGVVHRDIKPENILLDEAGNGYLSDFGIATLTGRLGAHQPQDSLKRVQSASSMLYLSPELAAGADPAPSADIYSLGLSIYELLSGQSPYPGLVGEALLEAHRQQPLPSIAARRPELPAGVDEVLQKATSADPASRYQDPLELARDLQAVLTGAAPAKAPLQAEVTNPSKGLRAFQETDAAEFYGRERMLARLQERLTPSSNLGANSRWRNGIWKPESGWFRCLAMNSA